VIGQTISHYRILEKLGEGGMGVVYKAEDLLLHRNVALKFPPDTFTHDEEIRSRFLNEARMAAGVLHPNVAILYEVGEYEGHPFLAMEFVDGHTLRKLVNTDGPFPIKTWIDVAIQLCEGVRAVHRKKMLHRDIKTENILFSHSEEVKIVDCGLGARFVESEGLAQELGVAGTTAYMSPEQARGEQIDQRSDIFSVGVVLYEILTGKLPFDADRQDALLYLLTNADPPPLETLRNDIPPDISAIIQRALEKHPAGRYQNIDEILKDLRRVKEGMRTR
jgi:eukaryotic-like serine/threonine-protein kinase